MKLWGVAAAVLALNIPFGYWRATTRKFSWQWILAVHLPVPAVIAMRILSGLGWQLISFPVLIGAFFLGQFSGGRLKRPNAATRCATAATRRARFGHGAPTAHTAASMASGNHVRSLEPNERQGTEGSWGEGPMAR